MEQLEHKKIGAYEAVDVTFHGRNQHPTETWERAVSKAESKGSEIVRVYGVPRPVLDTDTGLVYLAYQFSREITEKIQNGTLVVPKGISVVIDQETTDRMRDKEKRRLKNSTKVCRRK